MQQHWLTFLYADREATYMKRAIEHYRKMGELKWKSLYDRSTSTDKQLRSHEPRKLPKAGANLNIGTSPKHRSGGQMRVLCSSPRLIPSDMG